MTIGRIRVLVAGDVHSNRSLVRPFLEADGYEVASEPQSPSEVLPAVAREHPDAVVIDHRFLSGRSNRGMLEKIRREAPDARIVVVTPASSSTTGAIAGADAYLETGLGLAALSALLGGLLAGAPGGALAGPGTPASGSNGGSPGERIGGVVRFVATVGGPLLLAWALIAVVTSGGGEVRLTPADTTDIAGQIVVVPQGTDSFDEARDALALMLKAIEDGNYVLATIHARALMDAREAAIAIGYSTFGLDAEITAGIRSLAALLPPGVVLTLQDILGDLFPVFEEQTPAEQTPGGGSGLILGPGAGGGTSPSGGTDGTTGGGKDVGSGGGGGGNGGGGDGGGGDGGGGDGGGGDGGGGDGGGGDGGGGDGGTDDCHDHGNGSENGNGHEEHGNGNGYGHDHCDEVDEESGGHHGKNDGGHDADDESGDDESGDHGDDSEHHDSDNSGDDGSDDDNSGDDGSDDD